MCACVGVSVCACVRKWMYICMYVCIYIHIYIHTYICNCACVYIYIHKNYMHIYIYANIWGRRGSGVKADLARGREGGGECVYGGGGQGGLRPDKQKLVKKKTLSKMLGHIVKGVGLACVYVCMYIRMFVCICTYTYVCVCVYIYVCTYDPYIHVHIHICVHI